MPRSVTLSFELLETFVTLVREGGKAAAAMERLDLNQPTLSKRLKYLQHAGPLLDRPWLVLNGKTWALTDEGRRVWPAVAEIVDRYENLGAFLQGASGGQAAVRFACGQQMAVGLVREALREFRTRHPEARLRISTLRGRARIEGVSNGSLDLATVTHDEPAIREIARRPLHVEPLVTDHLALVAAAGSPWERKLRALPRRGAPAEAFTSFPLILPEPDAGVRKAVDEVLRHRGLSAKLDIALEIGGWSTILAYVRDGRGVGLVGEVALNGADGLLVRRLDPSVFRPIETRLICRRSAGGGEGLELSREATAWLDVLRRVCHRERGRAPGPVGLREGEAR
jgi:LysR family pca operon transcriptional activator